MLTHDHGTQTEGATHMDKAIQVVMVEQPTEVASTDVSTELNNLISTQQEDNAVGDVTDFDWLRKEGF